MFHIFQASIRNCLNCVYNCDDHCSPWHTCNLVCVESCVCANDDHVHLARAELNENLHQVFSFGAPL